VEFVAPTSPALAGWSRNCPNLWAPFCATFSNCHQLLDTRGIVISAEQRINDLIRASEIRLIGFSGEQVGIVDLATALNMADEVGLDLVEISPDAKPPVCKIMDFGKYKYEIAQKTREARQNQTHIVVKEIRFGLKIEPHDYETKKAHIARFLKVGDKVKVTVQFKGREQTRPEMGYRLLMKLAEEVADVAFVEFAPKKEGKSMTMVLGPVLKKTQVKKSEPKAAVKSAPEVPAPEAPASEVAAPVQEVAVAIED
jgi:translation initiation factor IF-3